MDYRQKRLKPWQIISHALRCCQTEDCDSCPYEYQFPQCGKLLDNAAELMVELRKKVDRFEKLLGKGD